MAAKTGFELLKLLRHSVPGPGAGVFPSRRLLRRPFCAFAESSVSQGKRSWLDFEAGQNSAENADSRDDFVIPSLAEWIQSYPLLDHAKFGQKPENGAEEASDADRICEIAKSHRESPDDVAKALVGCGVMPSKALLEQVLKRFSNDWVPAFGIFSWAKSQTGYVHSPEVCDLMVDVLGKSRKFHLMWDLVEEMSKMEGYVSLETMIKAIRRLARAGKFTDAIEAFKGMGRFGIDKNIESLNVLMDAMVKGDNVERAEEVFLAFKDEAGFSLASFNILIHGFCKCRKLDDARRVMEEAEKQGFKPDSVSYTCFVEAHCRERHFSSAKSILEEMSEKGCPPNVVTYTIYMHALGKAKQGKEALKVYEKIKSQGIVPDTSFCNSIIYILSQAGRSKDVDEIFRDMEAQGVNRNVTTYNTMIAAACARSSEEEALKLLKQMEVDSCQPNLKTYAALLKMCIRKKRMRVLQFLLSHMARNNVSIDLGTYELLVRGFVKSGKLDKACFFLEEMVSKGWAPKEGIQKLLLEKLDAAGLARSKEHTGKLMSSV